MVEDQEILKQVGDIASYYNRYKWKESQTITIGFNKAYPVTSEGLIKAIDRLALNWPKAKGLSLSFHFFYSTWKKKDVEDLSMSLSRKFIGLEILILKIIPDHTLKSLRCIGFLMNKICTNQRQLKQLYLSVLNNTKNYKKKRFSIMCIKFISKNLKELQNLSIIGLDFGEENQSQSIEEDCQIANELKKNLPKLVRVRINHYQQTF